MDHYGALAEWRSIHIIRHDKARHDTTRHDKNHRAFKSTGSDRQYFVLIQTTVFGSVFVVTRRWLAAVNSSNVKTIQKYFVMCHVVPHNVNGPWSWQEKNQSTRKTTYCSVTSLTVNSTWTALGLNPGLRGERLATNRHSYGTAIRRCLLICNIFFTW
jgi:hypothetical protein